MGTGSGQRSSEPIFYERAPPREISISSALTDVNWQPTNRGFAFGSKSPSTNERGTLATRREFSWHTLDRDWVSGWGKGGANDLARNSNTSVIGARDARADSWSRNAFVGLGTFIRVPSTTIDSFNGKLSIEIYVLRVCFRKYFIGEEIQFFFVRSSVFSLRVYLFLRVCF